MSKLAVDRFLALVERSGLIPPERLSSLIEQWKRQASAAELDSSADCGAFLVESGAITAWQCHKLLDGRHRGFMLGNYKLLDHLGSGGMSNVYLAEHVLMQRRVAIKVLPEHRVADASYLARFHFEGQAVAALDHPNIVRAYDLGSEGRIHYLVMEYVEGSDLEELIEQSGPLPYHLAARYISQAAIGLAHAHQAGLVHRDIKPANLLVDRSGVVKVLDMGLAKFQAEVRPAPDFARDEQVLGTAAYFAPEQSVNSQTVDGRADLYGLGCTLYFLLTGHPPFQGETPLELMTAHHRTTAPSVQVDRPDAPPALVAICAKLMEKLPEERFQTAQEVATALNAWLQSERTAGHIPPSAADDWAISATSPERGLSETDVSLHETAKIDRAKSRANRPSSHVFAPMDDAQIGERQPGESDVLTPPPPPTPPVVPPPRHAPQEGLPPVATSVRAVVPSAREQPSAIPAAPDFTPRTRGALAGQRRKHRGNWWWALTLSVLVLGALFSALAFFKS
jgi:serine/threonine protein kinase